MCGLFIYCSSYLLHYFNYSYNEVYTTILYISLFNTNFIATSRNANKKMLVIKPSSLRNKFASNFHSKQNKTDFLNTLIRLIHKVANIEGIRISHTSIDEKKCITKQQKSIESLVHQHRFLSVWCRSRPCGVQQKPSRPIKSNRIKRDLGVYELACLRLLFAHKKAVLLNDGPKISSFIEFY